MLQNGWSRIGLNTVRFGAYATGHKAFGDTTPSNLGALAGKLLDGNIANENVGMGQKALGFANDYATFLFTLGNGGSLVNLFDSSANASALMKVASGYSIGANYYMFYSDVKGLSGK